MSQGSCVGCLCKKGQISGHYNNEPPSCLLEKQWSEMYTSIMNKCVSLSHKSIEHNKLNILHNVPTKGHATLNQNVNYSTNLHLMCMCTGRRVLFKDALSAHVSTSIPASYKSVTKP